MIRHSLLALIVFLHLAGQNLFAQVNPSINYLPLKIGNTWVYSGSVGYPYYCSAYIKYKITGTSIFGNHLFYKFEHSVSTIYGNCQSLPNGRLFIDSLIRVDSTTAIIFNQTCMVDSLAARTDDSLIVCGTFYNPVHCDTVRNYWDTSKSEKNFVHSYFEGGENAAYIKGIGLVNRHLQISTYGEGMSLRGCVIDGVLYGDTNTLVGLNSISTEIPQSYKLYQNYPNPFNPNTKIQFGISKPSFTRLAVFDVDGRIISILVNEDLKPGIYEINWDASGKASGVYYYRLESGNFTDTKKLVLMK